MILLLTNPSLKALSSSFLSNRQINLTGRSSSSTTSGIFIFLPSTLQHLANCLQAIYKTIQQFNEHLKAERFDRQILHLIVLHLQNDFASVRYLLISSVGTFSNKDIAVKNSASSPLLNANPNPTSSALPLLCTDEPKLLNKG